MKTFSKFKFDLILPAYNPHIGWERIVVENYNNISLSFPEIEFNIFIVDDGATKGYSNGEIDYIKSHIKFVNYISYKENKGKGYALRYAVERTTSPFVIYTDYDFPYTSSSFKNVVSALINKADVVVAIRDYKYQKSLPFFRLIMSYSSHVINKLIFRMSVRDTQGGMKGFNEKGKKLFLNTTINTFLFDTQFVYKATKDKSIRLVQVPAMIRDNIKMSSMGINVLMREIKNIFIILRAN